MALIYLEHVSKNKTHLEEFRNHLLQSDYIQFQYLLSRIEASSASNDLLHEKAILYGKVRNFAVRGHP